MDVYVYVHVYLDSAKGICFFVPRPQCRRVGPLSSPKCGATAKHNEIRNEKPLSYEMLFDESESESKLGMY